MEKKVTLKDGTEVLIRDMKRDDSDRSLAFFQALPKEDKAYLRNRKQTHESIKRRIQAVDSGNVMRLVAVHDDQIVADGALELEAKDWKRHVAEIRVIVARAFQRKGLGTLMARELYLLANSNRVEEVMARIMGPQAGVQRIFEEFGFHKVARLDKYVKDADGTIQDLVIMRCKLEELWQRLEEHLGHSDWRRTR